MGNSKKISIIVPVYNMASDGKLNFCLDSLVSQTEQSIEIIAIDDASTDNSYEILKAYEAKYPAIFKVLKQEKNQRQGAAKNRGIEEAEGEWLSFIDSDDWIVPDFYEKLLKKAEETGADVVGGLVSLTDKHSFEPGKIIDTEELKITGALDHDKHAKMLFGYGYLVQNIYKASIIKDNNLRFPEGIFYEDNCAGPVWSMYFTHLERVWEPMYFYYQNASSTVHIITEERCRDRQKAMDMMLENMKERGFFNEYHDEIEYRFTELYFVNTLFSYMLGAKKKRIGYVKELKNEMVSRFPDFRSNPYYPRIKDEEIKRMIDLMLKNTTAFYVYYNLLWMYRNMRKKLKK